MLTVIIPPVHAIPVILHVVQIRSEALERLGPKALILIIRAPDRPSRANAISMMSNMRRNVCGHTPPTVELCARFQRSSTERISAALAASPVAW
jgi:hypothetical protein